MRYKIALAVLVTFAMSGFVRADSYVLSSSRACPVSTCENSLVATGTLNSPAVSSAETTVPGTGNAGSSLTTGFGFFKGSSAINLDTNLGFFSQDGFGRSEGDWVDTLTFSGSGSATLVIPFHLTGAVDTTYSFTDMGGTASPLVTTDMVFGFTYFNARNDGVTIGDGSADIKDPNGATNWGYDWQSSASVDKTLYIYLPVLLGAGHTNRFDLRFLVGAETMYQSFQNGVSGQLITTALTDFADTGVFMPGKLFDANGNEITETMQSDSGFSYLGAPAVAAPEPSSLVESMCGLLGLGLFLGIPKRLVRRA
jgi:hypothetical protein